MYPAQLYSCDADTGGILSVLLRCQLFVRPEIVTVRVLAAEHTGAGSGQPQQHDIAASALLSSAASPMDAVSRGCISEIVGSRK